MFINKAEVLIDMNNAKLKKNRIENLKSLKLPWIIVKPWITKKKLIKPKIKLNSYEN